MDGARPDGGRLSDRRHRLGVSRLLYWITVGYLGWWSPSDALVNPDLLATVVPWFSPLALSLQAGFWEECLFRAVPLAGAALVGDRFGRRRTWIAGAFVLQILIFGAGHAAYPTQPSYARVVELIVPSTIFGLLYLRFGLLPAIVMHFAFDAVLFGIPLFVSSAPGAWVDQGIFGLIFLTPLWVALRARYRGGAWIEAPAALRNAAWSPAAADAAAAPAPAPFAGVGRVARPARGRRGRRGRARPVGLHRRGPQRVAARSRWAAPRRWRRPARCWPRRASTPPPGPR